MRSLARWPREAGRTPEAEAAVGEAVGLLEPVGLSRELGRAYGARCQFCMIVADLEGTVAWGAKAIELAERGMSSGQPKEEKRDAAGRGATHLSGGPGRLQPLTLGDKAAKLRVGPGRRIGRTTHIGRRRYPLETAASTRRASDAGQLWAIETPPAAIAKARLVRDARRVVALAGLRNVPGSVRSGGCSFDPRGDDGARAFTREQ